MPYITDTKTGIFVHEIKAWQKTPGDTWRPMIYNGEALVFPDDHVVYKNGWEVIEKLF